MAAVRLIVEPFLIPKEQEDNHHRCTDQVVIKIVFEKAEFRMLISQFMISSFVEHCRQRRWGQLAKLFRAQRSTLRLTTSVLGFGPYRGHRFTPNGVAFLFRGRPKLFPGGIAAQGCSKPAPAWWLALVLDFCPR